MQVLEASIEDDGDEFTIVVTFKRHDIINNVNSDSDDSESVEELRGVSRELLRTYGSGRRSNMSNGSNRDDFGELLVFDCGIWRLLNCKACA
jgi:hypothetical protein